MKYAAEGDSSGVEGIQEEMQDLGMEPGPFANHPLVFAHVKAGHPDEGLEVMREMFASGVQPELVL